MPDVSTSMSAMIDSHCVKVASSLPLQGKHGYISGQQCSWRQSVHLRCEGDLSGISGEVF